MRRATATLAALAVFAISGCGGSSKPTLVVSAAASLQTAFTSYGGQFKPAKARFSFAGSDTLATQIEQGVHPDVLATAHTRRPEMLHAKGLVEAPVVFTSNRLVLAVPSSSSSITSLADAEKAGVVLAIGTPTVPVGEYTRKVLAKLPDAEHAALTKNVKDEESDVTGIVGKLTQGAVQAGFLYATDVTATHGKLKAIELPASLQPKVAYAVAIVKGSAHRSQAQQFIDGLVSGEGRKDLTAAGFRSP